MAAAVACATLGMRVVLVEKDGAVGGTAASAGGFLWIPNNPLSKAAGAVDTHARAFSYMQHEAGSEFDPRKADAYLASGPSAVEFFHDRTALQFEPAPAAADYHPDAIGGSSGGRVIRPKDFDARQLGAHLSLLRPPVRELTLNGLMVGSGAELAHFLNATSSLPSSLHVARRLLGYARDIAIHRRNMTLKNGNAMIARLLRSAIDLGVGIRTNTSVQELTTSGGTVTGGILRTPQGRQSIAAGQGVVLATGGFPQDAVRRRQLFPHESETRRCYSMAPSTNTGDGIRLAESLGANFQAGASNPILWVPVSLVPKGDAEPAPFPHILDRGKPGLIAVLPDGTRFTNEADSYHEFCLRLIARSAGSHSPPRAYLVVDSVFLRRYGLGFVKPFPIPFGRHLRSGYLKSGRTLAELAGATGVDARGLEKTVAGWNEDVTSGRDRTFGKGETAYNRSFGDSRRKPNPCLAPIAKAPFFALEVRVGDTGTLTGLRTDEHARVLDADRKAIDGLYAVGNDMTNVMAGAFNSGIMLGPALVFGYIAARHMRGRTQSAQAARERAYQRFA